MNNQSLPEDSGERLLLYLTGELEEAERRELEQRLRESAALRAELESLRSFVNFMDDKGPAPSTSMIAGARAQLLSSLGSRAQNSGPVSRKAWRLRPWAAAASWLLCFALGAAAVLVFQPESATKSDEGRNADLPTFMSTKSATEFQIAGVTINALAADSDSVEVQMELTRTLRLRGSFEDRAIRHSLAYALANESNPGVRLRSAALLGNAAEGLDDDVKQVLLTAMTSDENPGVRKRALDALSEAAFDDAIRNGMLHVLQHDANAGLRIAAINALASLGHSRATADSATVSILRNKGLSDDNSYIRIRAAELLKEIQL